MQHRWFFSHRELTLRNLDLSDALSIAQQAFLLGMALPSMLRAKLMSGISPRPLARLRYFCLHAENTSEQSMLQVVCRRCFRHNAIL